MKKTRFTESQIVTVIRRQESGVSDKELCRELGISEATFYNWKAKYGGMYMIEFIAPAKQRVVTKLLKY